MPDFTAIVAITTVFGAGVLIVAIVMWVHYRKSIMRNQERLAAIEKGIPLPDLAEGGAPLGRNHYRHPLRGGIRLLFIGAGLAGALYVSAGPTAAVWGGFVAFIGLGDLVYWALVGRKVDNPPPESPR
ncbi:MAG: DUF6249 domain-containing protein [Acidobacteriota bacterium]